MPEATQQGVSSKPKKKQDGPIIQVEPDLARFNQIEQMADHLREERVRETQEALDGDPGFRVQHEERERERLEAEGLEKIERIETDPEEEEAKQLSTAGPEKEVDREQGSQRAAPDQEEEEGDPEDPLAKYIVMGDDDTPMFSAKVDGKRVLIPLDRAQAQLQKHEAAERRLQQAAELSRSLDERERALRENEQVLRQRLQNLTPPPSSQDVDDEALQAQARELVETLFSGTEDEAAEKLAKVLGRNRASSSATPPIDPRELATTAARMAQEQIQRDNLERDSKAGFEQFAERYPDILSDHYLFQVADGMTDEIAQEHPDWMPSRVMLEAGKRTREWRDQRDGKKPEPKPQPSVDAGERQSRKAKLVTVPRPATARPEKESEEGTETPQDIVREMRKARNQPL